MSVTQPFYLRVDEAPELPKGWKYLTTEEATIQLKPGKLFDKKTAQASGRVPILSQGEADFIGFHNEAPGVIADVQTPVVTFANHTCAMRLMTAPFSCIQNIFPKVGKEGEVDTRYFFYAAKGRVNLSDYKGHHPLFRQGLIPVPPVQTQRRIASILGAYDDLIEVNRRRIAVLEEMARGLFKEWFVRFRFPGHEAVPILDTPDGALPEGWTWGTLGDLLSLPYGKALKADARRPGDVAVIGSSGVVGSHVEALVAGPGIVVGRKGNVGSVIWSATDFWPIDTTYYVDTRLPLLYVYQLLQRVPFENSHAAVPGLNRDYALARVVMIAPDALVQRYGAFSEPLMDQVTTLGRSNRSLAASRDLLLPRLISGQLSVAEAERELEEAA